MPLIKIVCITGPTCTGKSKIVIDLSKKLPIEIINADASTIYKYMNIGTAKPNYLELTQIKHNLINILDLSDTYSVINFCTDVKDILISCLHKKKIPIIVGGNLMYLWALQNFFFKKKQFNIKNKKCHIDNVYDLNFLNIGLIPINKITFKKKIKKRLENMIKLGFIEEVNYLHNNINLDLTCNALNSIGYKDFWLYLNNKIKIHETKNSINAATYELANKQLLWLKKWKNIIYFDHNNKHSLIKIHNLINNFFFIQ